jgi:hypothetical protein
MFKTGTLPLTRIFALVMFRFDLSASLVRHKFSESFMRNLVLDIEKLPGP